MEESEDIIEYSEKLLEEGNFEKIITLLKDIKLPEAYLLRAKALEGLGMLDKAIEDIEEGLKKFPYSHYLYYELSLIRLRKGDLEGALNDIERAISIVPFSFEYNKLKGKILFMLEDYEEAYNVLGYVIKLKADDVESRILRSECFYRIGRYLDALAE
ncbi:MAG: tetratricopeptide repeat protein, partial [Sulfolobus sp.]|nr:tetratricopeptide repeat protein [Sulfolobus sp.]